MSFQGRNISKHDQATGLKNGLQLAWALNRTLILPTFYCEKGYCNFLDIFGRCISILDEMDEVTYREHMFLENPIVPEKVRTHTTDVVNISDKAGARTVKEDISDLLEELYPFRNYSIINVSMPHNILFSFNYELTRHLQALHKPICKPARLKTY